MGVINATSPATPRRLSPFALVVLALGAVAGIAVLSGGKWGVAGIAGLLIFLLFVRRPLWGVYSTAVLLLLAGQTGVLAGSDAQLTLSKLVGAAALGAWLLHVLIHRKRVPVTWAAVVVLVFLGWNLLSTITGIEPANQGRFWLRLAMLAGFFIITYAVLDAKVRIREFVVLLCLCGLVMSTISVIQYLFPQFHVSLSDDGSAGPWGGALVDPESLEGQAAVRVSGSMGHSNWLSLTILLLLPLNLAWLYGAKGGWMRALVVITVAMELCALVLTFTRVGLVVSACMLLLVAVRGMMRVTPERIVAFLIMGALGFVVLPAAYKERVLHFGQYTGSESVKMRLGLQNAAWEIWQDAPLRGLGVGAFGIALDDMDSRFAHDMMAIWKDYYGWEPVFLGAHNLYLQTMVESGVIGLALLLAFYAVLVVYLEKSYQRASTMGDQEGRMLCLSVQVSLIGFLICGIFLHALLEKIDWLIAALAVALWLQYGQHVDGAGAQPMGYGTARRQAR